MTPRQHAQMIFDAAIAAHRIACRTARNARRAGADEDTRRANRDRRRAAYATVQTAYDALIATY